MKILASLREFWSIPISKRKYYTVGERISTSYPIVDNGEILVKVIPFFKKNNTKIEYTPPDDIAKIKQDLLLRTSACKRLLQASKILPKGYYFVLSEGFRPLWFQRQEFNNILKDIAARYPKWSKEKIWEETTMYVADPDLSPPHSSGGTFDLSIKNDNGERLDMGIPINSVDERSNTFTKKLTRQQRKNRHILYDSLTSVGFVNFPSEWWHYSYGDQYWAIFNKEKSAIYGKLER